MRLAVDTNVLVRYLTRDDEAQAAAAQETLLAADSLVIPMLVFTELVWVLHRAYRYPIAQIAAVLRQLIATWRPDIDTASVEAGLRMMDLGGDFADGVIHLDSRRARCGSLLTFDRKLAGRLPPGSARLLGAA